MKILIISLILFFGIFVFFSLSGVFSTPDTTQRIGEVPEGTPVVTPSIGITTIEEPLVKKKITIKETELSMNLDLNIETPKDVTVQSVKFGVVPGVVLKKGDKIFMGFVAPSEFYDRQGYSSASPVNSDTVSNLRRIRSNKVYKSSYDYMFAVSYVKSGDLKSGNDCTKITDTYGGDPTTSPCAEPALHLNSGNWFQAFCSVEPEYIKICDSVMKTITAKSY